MSMPRLFTSALTVALTLTALSAEAAKAPTHPCRVIVKQCKKAGFVKGWDKSGKGLHDNCFMPLVDAQYQPKTPTARPLPKIAEATRRQCAQNIAAHKKARAARHGAAAQH